MRRTANGERRMEGDGVLLACASSDVPRLFADDVLTCCARCRTSIYHRPGALADLPAGARPACLPCAARHEQADGVRRSAFEEAAHGELAAIPAGRTPSAMRRTPATAGITRRTLDEVARYLAEQPR